MEWFPESLESVLQYPSLKKPFPFSNNANRPPATVASGSVSGWEGTLLHQHTIVVEHGRLSRRLFCRHLGRRFSLLRVDQSGCLVGDEERDGMAICVY